MVLTFVLSFPISAILDKVLGADMTGGMSRNKMKKFFEMQEDDNILNKQERRILQATLDMSRKTVEEVMTELGGVYMLDIDSNIDRKTLKEIYMQGFSRIPVFEGNRQNVVGILMAKDLILFNPDKNRLTLKQLFPIMRPMVCVEHDCKLEAVLHYFSKGTTHIALVSKVVQEEGKDPTFQKVGLVTLEDIIEAILDAKIEDEYEVMSELKTQKERIVALFLDKHAGTILDANEVHAICEFLAKYVTPFGKNCIRH